MFLGHFAIGFAAKRWAPRTSEGLLLAAPEFADLLWPVFLLLGWERVRIDPGNTRFTPFDPDLPLYPGGARYGLGLWNSVAGTMAVELSKFAAGIWIYVRQRGPRIGSGGGRFGRMQCS